MSPVWTDPDGLKHYVDENVTSYDQMRAWADEQNRAERPMDFMIPIGAPIQRHSRLYGIWRSFVTTMPAYYMRSELRMVSEDQPRTYRISIPDMVYDYIEVTEEYLYEICHYCGGKENLGQGEAGPCPNCDDMGYGPKRGTKPLLAIGHH